MESSSSGSASLKDFSNEDRDSMSSSSENYSVKYESNNKGQSYKAGTDIIIESTAKEDTVPMML
eukprot:12562563-Ditylum_brightwellii.AAC.1